MKRRGGGRRVAGALQSVYMPKKETHMNSILFLTKFTFHRRGSQASAGDAHRSPPGVAWLLIGLVLGCLGGYVPQASAQDMKPDTLAKTKKAAVMVFTARSENEKGDRPMGSGSGFFINSTGLLVTNNHVVDPTHMKSPEEKHNFHYRGGRLTWTVITDGGTDEEKKWECAMVYQNETADQAMLQAMDAEGKKLETPHFLRFLPESRLHNRMKVWAFGFPGGDSERSVRDKHPVVSVDGGNIIDLPRTPGGRIRRIYTDMRVRPGNSGGATVDADGFLIGTVTLMSKPEGREDTGGANYSALVPAKLTREMIRNAFDLGKIAEGSDYTPFIEVMANSDGRIVIPEYPRLKDREVLVFDNGDRVYGGITTDKIVWESPLGTLNVPTDAIAYLIKNGEGASLFLEGGNRISTDKASQEFDFKPDGGAKYEQTTDTVSVVGFRTKDRRLAPVSGVVVVLDADVSHLVLTDVKGTAKFKTRAGTLDIPLDEIARIELAGDPDQPDAEQVLIMTDERRLTGQFEKDLYSATIAATGTQIQFDLSRVQRATVEVLRFKGDGIAGLDLEGVLESADRDIARVAKSLVSGKPADARKKLDTLLASEDFKRLPDVKREQISFLDGVADLRTGEFEDAMKTLRKATKASDENISAFAQACVAVLKRFDQKFQGQPLSEPAVFAAAGAVLAEELIAEVRGILRDAKNLEGEKKAEYTQALADVKKHETSMRIAAVFSGVEAEDELVRLWKLASDACFREILRLEKAIKEKQEAPRGTSRGQAQGAQRRMQKEMEDLQKERERAIETYRFYAEKLWEYGFRIQDPDIQAQKEKSGDPEEEKDDDDKKRKDPKDPDDGP